MKTTAGRKHIYAIKCEKSNDGYLFLKFWVLGGVSRVKKISISDCEKFATQIDEALSNNEYVISFSDVEKYDASEKILKDLQKTFKSCVVASGGIDADTVHSGVAAKKEASATTFVSPSRKALKASKNSSHNSEQRSPSAADISADAHFIEQHEATPRPPVVEETKKPAHTVELLPTETAKIFGCELRKAVAPLLVELDSIGALLSECIDKLAEDLKAKQQRGFCEAKPSERVQTKRGRTSVVVSRKVIK